MTSTAPPNGAAPAGLPPKITLYTNHACPYAHRAHIALEELGLPFDEVPIDLNTPRPDWYLAINPRGLVPSMKYSVPGLFDGKEETLTESAIVAGFLADSFPSPLLPATRADPSAPLRRARIAFFTDTWNSKINAFYWQTMLAPTPAEREAKVSAWVSAVEKEIEPLLADAKPFFGGSEAFTFAEVIVAPFVLRWEAFSRDGEFVPRALQERLDALPHFGPWSRAVRARPSVRKVWREEFVEATKGKVRELAAAAAAAKEKGKGDA